MKPVLQAQLNLAAAPIGEPPRPRTAKRFLRPAAGAVQFEFESAHVLPTNAHGQPIKAKAVLVSQTLPLVERIGLAGTPPGAVLLLVTGAGAVVVAATVATVVAIGLGVA